MIFGQLETQVDLEINLKTIFSMVPSFFPWPLVLERFLSAYA